MIHLASESRSCFSQKFLYLRINVEFIFFCCFPLVSILFILFLFYLFRETYIEQKQGESSNDRNDRAIRVAVKWYNEHLKNVEDEEKIQVIFLTNDRTNKEKALEEGITAYTCK